MQLSKTRIGVHIHGSIGKLAHNAISWQTMTRLEALDGCINISIERAGNTCFARKITRNNKTLTQSLHRLRIRTQLQLRIAGNLWPATAACYIGILGNR
ncbi:hypothetical protein D9M68_843620 [compost metagenome]